LLVDADSQHSLTVSLGIAEPDALEVSLGTIISDIIAEKGIDPQLGIVRHSEGIDLMPANNSLTGMEIALTGQIGRETILRQYIGAVKSSQDYVHDYVLVDTAPTLDLLSVNALAAADSVIIPVAPKYLDAKGLESRSQIFRLLRLTELILDLLDRVDSKQLALNPAVELSHLSQQEQKQVASAMENGGIKPSLSQAVRLKKLKQNGALTNEMIDEILSECKSSSKQGDSISDDQSESVSISRYRKFFPESFTSSQMDEVILKLLQDWQLQQSEVA